MNSAYHRQMAENSADSANCQESQSLISGIPATHLKTLSNYAIQKISFMVFGPLVHLPPL
ncbi:MAG: hypothetical protein AB8V50_00665 [Arsenophonus endosymbiont of Dermacentor nuttalli]